MTQQRFHLLTGELVNRTRQSIVLLIMVAAVAVRAKADDLLPSWNDGAAKRSIVEFVAKVTYEDGPEFVVPAERIAVFDNDGTLWCEQPVVQIMYLRYELERMAEKDPSSCTQLPFQAAFDQGTDYLKTKGFHAFLELFATTHAGMSEEEFRTEVKEFFATAKHPKFDVPIRHIVYQPMIELLEYLRANGFKTYICSGGSTDFIRVVSTFLYGIGPEQVIGSSVTKELQKVEGQWALTRTGKLASLNNKDAKPVNIDLHIGRHPLFAMGNVRSGGDIAMLRYSQQRQGASLQLLINHDDANREFAYAENNRVSLNAATANGWSVVSMKRDWKVIFAFER